MQEIWRRDSGYIWALLSVGKNAAEPEAAGFEAALVWWVSWVCRTWLMEVQIWGPRDMYDLAVGFEKSSPGGSCS